MRNYHCHASIELYETEMKKFCQEHLKTTSYQDADIWCNLVIEGYKRYSGITITIGYDQTNEYMGDPEEKNFHFLIYLSDKDVIKVCMKPGSVSIKSIDWKKNIIDFEFDKSANNQFPWIKSMRIRNIIGNRRSFAQEDAIQYHNFLTKLNELMIQHPEYTQEEAADMIKMPNNGKTKSLHQKMIDIKDAIEYFCDPSKERISDIPENVRLLGNAPLKDLSILKTTINSRSEFTRKKESPYKRHCLELLFNSMPLDLHESIWLEAAKNLSSLSLINCTISDTSDEAWNLFGNGIEKFENLSWLELSTNLDRIPDFVFQKLPKRLTDLILSKNKLKILSPYISCLTKLQMLILEDNFEMIDIPWKSLPQSLRILNIGFTDKPSINGILCIPSDIERLVNLEFLNLEKNSMQSIAWSSLSKTVADIVVGDVKNLNEINFAPQLTKIGITDAIFENTEILSSFPNINKMGIRRTNLKKFTFPLNYLSLNYLDLSDNNLTEFPWEFITHKFEEISLCNNKIEIIGSPIYWTKVEMLKLAINKIHTIVMDGFEKCTNDLKMSVNLSRNPLTSLPIGFENLTGIKSLSLRGILIDCENENEALWNRIPSSLKVLDISETKISTLPCILKNFALEKLNAAECDLQWICPYLSRHETLRSLDISNNPDIKYFPFLPKKPYLFPKDSNKTKKEVNFYMYENEIKTEKNLKILTTQTKFICTERTYKLNYNFKMLQGPKQFYECFCCGKCGKETDYGLTKEIMTMDIEMFVMKEDFRTLDLFLSKEWKTNVKTRICESCIQWYKNEGIKFSMIKKRKTSANKKDFKKLKIDDTQTELYSNPMNNSEIAKNSLPIGSYITVPAVNVKYQFNEPFGSSSRTLPSIQNIFQISKQNEYVQNTVEIFNDHPYQIPTNSLNSTEHIQNVSEIQPSTMLYNFDNVQNNPSSASGNLESFSTTTQLYTYDQHFVNPQEQYNYQDAAVYETPLLISTSNTNIPQTASDDQQINAVNEFSDTFLFHEFSHL